jgi:hypothetical protein
MEGLAAEPAASPTRDRDRDVTKMGCLSGLPAPEVKWYPELPESNLKRGDLALRTIVNRHFRVRREGRDGGEDRRRA